MKNRTTLLILIAFMLMSIPKMVAQDATPEATTETSVVPIELPVADPLDWTGSITIAGSSTVYPLAEKVVELASEEGFEGITLDSIGSGAGFERFCKTGETDISTASRGIKQEEVDNCAKIGRTPIEFRIGTDALTVVVSQDNTFVQCLTMAQLGSVFAGKVTKWSEIDASFPDKTIAVFSPGTDSGTFDYMVEAAVQPLFADAEKPADEAYKALLNVPGIQLSEDDNVLVKGVESDQFALGYFGFAYFNANQDHLRAVQLDKGSGCVTPDDQTAEDNTYPLSRPLFLYTDAALMKAKPQVAGLINFFLTNVNTVILDVGYFPASTSSLNEAKQAWLDAVS